MLSHKVSAYTFSQLKKIALGACAIKFRPFKALVSTNRHCRIWISVLHVGQRSSPPLPSLHWKYCNLCGMIDMNFNVLLCELSMWSISDSWNPHYSGGLWLRDLFVVFDRFNWLILTSCRSITASIRTISTASARRTLAVMSESGEQKNKKLISCLSVCLWSFSTGFPQ